MNTRMLKDIYGNNVVVDVLELKKAHEKMEFEQFIRDLDATGYKLQKNETYESIYQEYKKEFVPELSVYDFIFFPFD